MLNFHQWLEANNLTVMGGNQPAPMVKRKPCKECGGPMTDHKSGMCAKCRKDVEAYLDAEDERPHPDHV